MISREGRKWAWENYELCVGLQEVALLEKTMELHKPEWHFSIRSNLSVPGLAAFLVSSMTSTARKGSLAALAQAQCLAKCLNCFGARAYVYVRSLDRDVHVHVDLRDVTQIHKAHFTVQCHVNSTVWSKAGLAAFKRRPTRKQINQQTHIKFFIKVLIVCQR